MGRYGRVFAAAPAALAGADPARHSRAAGRHRDPASVQRHQWFARHGRSARLRGVRLLQRAHPGEWPALPGFRPAGFRLFAIPLDSIARIEITRGNSGAVLYGDGAVDGVINIFTKTGAGAPATSRVEVLAGSSQYWEGRVSTSVSSGPWSIALAGNAIDSTGYRVNSALRQRNIDAQVNYTALDWSAYLTLLGDRQSQGLPGELNSLPGGDPYTRKVGPCFGTVLLSHSTAESCLIHFARRRGPL